MIRIDVHCKGCGELLDEPPDLPSGQRQPCPACGHEGRERTVLMIPGEAAPVPGSADAAWLEHGANLARAASSLELLLKGEELSPKERSRIESAWLDVLRALEEYREANKQLHRG